MDDHDVFVTKLELAPLARSVFRRHRGWRHHRRHLNGHRYLTEEVPRALTREPAVCHDQVGRGPLSQALHPVSPRRQVVLEECDRYAMPFEHRPEQRVQPGSVANADVEVLACEPASEASPGTHDRPGVPETNAAEVLHRNAESIEIRAQPAVETHPESRDHARSTIALFRDGHEHAFDAAEEIARQEMKDVQRSRRMEARKGVVGKRAAQIARLPASTYRARVPKPRRLLTIGHSYVVALNRRLAHEMSRAGRDRWEVTCASPRDYPGDLEQLSFRSPGEPNGVATLSVWGARRVHTFVYGPEVRALLSDDWDVIHAWEEPYVLATFQLASWANRRSMFVPWSAQNLVKHYPPPFSLFERRVLERADGWLYCGNSVREALFQKPAYAKKPSALAPLGVDLQVFSPDPEVGARVRDELGWTTPGPPVVGYAGRFVPEKGVQLLMDALARCRSPWRALFLGAGRLEPELAAFSRKYPGSVKIIRSGHDDVPRYLNAMDVLCAPSRSTRAWSEQFGRMVVEAFACGVPVISSDNGELPHVVGDAGILLPVHSPSTWQRAIEDLLESPTRRAELARSGLERVRHHFAWPVVAARYLEFFSTLVDRAASRDRD